MKWLAGLGILASIVALGYLAVVGGIGWTNLGERRAEGLGNFEENVRALPAPKDGRFRFAVMGDPEEGLGTWRLLMSQAREQGAAFVVITGDVAHAPTPEAFELFVHDYRSLVPAGLPTFAAAGNHDRAKNGDASLFRTHLGPENFSFTYGDCLFVISDNNIPEAWPESLRYIRGEIARHKGQVRHTFLILHQPIEHNPVFGPIMSVPECREDLIRLLDSEKITAVLMGHYHAYFRGEYKGTLLLVTGGAGGSLQSRESFFHMVLIDVSPEGIQDTLVRGVPGDGPASEMRCRLMVDQYPVVFRPIWPALSILIGSALILFFSIRGLRKPRSAAPVPPGQVSPPPPVSMDRD